MLIIISSLSTNMIEEGRIILHNCNAIPFYRAWILCAGYVVELEDI